MSANSVDNAVHQFLQRLKSSKVIEKQNELKEIITDPLQLAREKGRILES